MIGGITAGLNKPVKKSKWVTSLEADLDKDVDEIEEYTRTFVAPPPKNKFFAFLDRLVT